MPSISGLINSARRARGAFLLGLLLTLTLSACGGNIYNTSTQSQTPSPTSASTATPTPKPATAFAYAFARNAQVWVAQAGKSPQQLSQLPTVSGESISSLAWSPDDKHLAFEVAGAGSPVDYVIDTSTGSFSPLNFPSTSATATLGWDSDTIVVAVKTISGNEQFWKTDITTNTSSKLTQVTGTPQVKILGGGIFYSLFDTTSNQLMLHRYDIGTASEGTPVAITPAGTSTLNVNWDVSPDGSHVLMGFSLPTPDSTWGNGFWSINFSNSSDISPVFTNDELPFSNFTSKETITLSFSPDGQTVLIDTNGSVGPISEGLDDSNFTKYSPAVGITSPSQISWAPNGSSFALIGSNGQATIYTLAKPAGATFASPATLLQWAPQS